jgi:hypothetical protein
VITTPVPRTIRSLTPEIVTHSPGEYVVMPECKGARAANEVRKVSAPFSQLDLPQRVAMISRDIGGSGQKGGANVRFDFTDCRASRRCGFVAARPLKQQCRRDGGMATELAPPSSTRIRLGHARAGSLAIR